MPKALLDPSDASVLVTCDSCTWRAVAGTRGGAWKFAAQHLKRVHGDLQAARRATNASCQWVARERVQRQEGGKRGNQGRNQGDRARAVNDRGSA